MKYLFNNLEPIKKDLGDKSIMLFLDYDGTLAPIAQRPEGAVMPPAVKNILKQLMECPDLNIIIITGRALEDIKSRVGLKNITYVANHGLEIEGPKLKWRFNPSRQYKTILESIKNNLNKHAAAIKGVFTEDKSLSLSFHYRMADKKHIPLAKAIFHADTALYVVSRKIKVKAGKMVLEVRPALEWDKGKAVLWLLAKQRFLAKKQAYPVYIGDDKTDEDAFKVLKKKGLTLFVGHRRSGAKYYLKNTDEVLEFLSYVRINKGKTAV